MFLKMIIIANAGYWLDQLSALSEGDDLPEPALHGAARALDVAAATPEAWDLVLPLASAIHPHMKRRGYWTQWDTFLQYLIYHAKRQMDHPAQINFLMKLGHIKRLRSDYDAAIRAYRRAWRLCRDADHPTYLASTLSNLGELYRTQKHFWRAEILCKRALTLFEALDDPLRRAYTENNLALVYLDQRYTEDAEVHFERALRLFETLDHQAGLMLVWKNLSAMYLQRDNPEKALTYLQKSLAQCEQCGDEVEAARAYLNIGHAYLCSDHLAQAEAVSLKAESVLERVDDTVNLARVRHNLGMIYTRQQQWQEAERCFRWALEQWRAREDTWAIANTLGELADLHLDQGGLPQAQVLLDEVTQLISKRTGPAYKSLQRELAQRRQRLSDLKNSM